MKEEESALGIGDAATFLGVHPQTVRKLAKQGDIPCFKVGQAWRFRREALQHWVDTHHIRSRSPIILIVEDDRNARDTTRFLLQNESYCVRTAASGGEALALMSQERPDLILLDLQMPMMDGPTTLRHVRNMHGNVPVIICTGYPDSELMSRALEYGPITMMAKPVKKEQLLEGVLTALRIPRTNNN